MADVNFFDDFERVWGTNGDVEAIDQNQYDQGWAFIGATPPSVEQFNKVQQVSDQKAAWLFAQMKTLAQQGGYELSSAADDALALGIGYSIQRGDAITGVDTGAANSYVVDYAPPVATLIDGMALWFRVGTANTGASTLNVNGIGARPVIGMGHAPLQGGEMAANGKALVVWKADANSWVLVSCSGGAPQVVAATKSGHPVQLGQFTGANQSISYQKFPGNPGLIVQWGGTAVPAGVTQTITLPITFPNTWMVAVCSHAGTDATVNAVASPISNSQLSLRHNFSQTSVIHWIELGN
ncbi:hypothetical protein CURE108131_21075 [Cupriavidus respiraculi]|uniref:Putative tail fiber protein gp53-like C-terminal domain-containing protein n=1 Tax=Cupriavidus respiraculi TaxID=195930 RepID=A0ABM8WZM0_9BURK|nr:hypothetical protein [Cupriavidus respiraculi]CAG9173032.1 hypothetical protein LMG21510_02139 [Cupriavidus respiraculi]